MKNSHIVVGLSFGDEGKGSWVDHLVRKTGAKYVVRMNGGAQAVHYVVTPEGLSHGFSQFSSGTFVPGTATCLSRFMLIDPELCLEEASKLHALGVTFPLERLIVSDRAPILTPFNRILNRMQEIKRGGSKHGSCGLGIGLTQGDVETLGDRAVYVRDLQYPSVTLEKLRWLRDFKIVAAQQELTPENSQLFESLKNVDLDYYVQLYAHWYARVRVLNDESFSVLLRENDTVFEGSQGLLIDQHYGFFPHCTRSNCTFENAELLLKEAGFEGKVNRVGLLRGYATRHGPGPFVTEDSGVPVPPCDNKANRWQEQVRVGWFDGVAARYALDITGPVDTLAVTNLDRMTGMKELKVGVKYHTPDSEFFLNGKFRVARFEGQLLAERSKILATVKPEYQTVCGWGFEKNEDDRGYNRGHNRETDEEGMKRYLQTLSQVLQHPIHAYSASATHHHKVYL